MTKFKSILIAFFVLGTCANAFAAGMYTMISAPLVLTIVVAFVFLMALIAIGERLVGIEAQNLKGSNDVNLSVLPNREELVGKSQKSTTSAGHASIRLKKGMDIKLSGNPSAKVTDVQGTRYALKPTDFLGMSPIPKVVKEIGESIKAGEVLFYDKKRPEIKYVAPFSGEFIELNRGEKRRIEELVILADSENDYHMHQVGDDMGREEIINFLLNSGAWSLLKQRPYGIVPDAQETPRDIFISTFDTSPYAPDTALIVAGKGAEINMAVDILSKLTDGRVHLGLQSGNVPVELDQKLNAVKTFYNGPHPAGNVGVQIHNTAPLSTKDMVWTLGLQELITLGTLFTEGKWDASRVVSVGGTNLENPRHVRCVQGINMTDVFKHFQGLSKEDRIISGDILTGSQIGSDGFLGFYNDQISVVREGNYNEMFGWLLPQKMRPSASRTYPSFLFKNMAYDVDTNTHGERRAFVVTGQYEKVLPMDIYPQQLFKAILSNDLEKMEGLGIHELLEEDVALCEFVCTSKMPLQQILRSGLDDLREQG